MARQPSRQLLHYNGVMVFELGVGKELDSSQLRKSTSPLITRLFSPGAPGALALPSDACDLCAQYVEPEWLIGGSFFDSTGSRPDKVRNVPWQSCRRPWRLH